MEIAAAKLALRPKARKTDTLERSTAKVFSRGQLHYLLTNPVYLGRIRHKAVSYAGLHPAIIEQQLWDDVQAKLQAAHARPRGRSAVVTPSRCLIGKLRDETGDLLTPTHTIRRGIRYTYYVSNRLIEGGVDPSAWRIPAPAFEATLKSILVAHLRQAAGGYTIQAVPDVVASGTLVSQVDQLCQRIASETVLFASLIDGATLSRDTISLRINATALADTLAIDADSLSSNLLTFQHKITLRRRGVELRILAGDCEPAPDEVLIRVVAESRNWAKALRSGTPLATLAKTTGRSEPYIRVRLPLAFLSPKLQIAILEGRQRADLSAARLISQDIPFDWAEQERQFC